MTAGSLLVARFFLLFPVIMHFMTAGSLLVVKVFFHLFPVIMHSMTAGSLLVVKVFFHLFPVIMHSMTAGSLLVLGGGGCLTEGGRENSNLKTLFYNDCSLGSIRHLSNN